MATWVTVTKGPEWAIGKTARLNRAGDFIIFYNHMGEPHWYSVHGFTFTVIPTEPAPTQPLDTTEKG